MPEGHKHTILGVGNQREPERVTLCHITAETATKARVVSIDSSSKSPMSKESTREMSLVASATVLT